MALAGSSQAFYIVYGGKIIDIGLNKLEPNIESITIKAWFSRATQARSYITVKTAKRKHKHKRKHKDQTNLSSCLRLHLAVFTVKYSLENKAGRP